jgi:hypothetical protein
MLNVPADITSGKAGTGRKRRRRDAGTPEMHRRMEMARAAREPDWAKNNFKRRGTTKVEALLKPEDREPYAALLRDPRVSDPQRSEWLKARGYQIGVSAVRTDRQKFDESLRALREAARFASNFRELFGAHAPSTMSDVSLTRLQQVLTERLFPGEDKNGNKLVLKIEDLAQLSKLIGAAIDDRRRVELLRRDFEHVCHLVAREVERIGKPGTDGVLVANRVKQLLGVPLGPETPEEAAAAERQFVPFDLAELENSSPAAGSPPESGAGAAVAPGL